jgi:hypothetical protein
MLLCLLLTAVFQIGVIMLTKAEAGHAPSVAKTCGDRIDTDQRPTSRSVLC